MSPSPFATAFARMDAALDDHMGEQISVIPLRHGDFADMPDQNRPAFVVGGLVDEGTEHGSAASPLHVHVPDTTWSVEIRREKKKIVVEIQDFISPSIVERLAVDVPLFRAKIPDWRSMLDCVMIDAAHDGAVFNVSLSVLTPSYHDVAPDASAKAKTRSTR